MKEFMKVLLGILYVVFSITFYVSVMVLSVLLYLQEGVFSLVFTLMFGIPFCWAAAGLVKFVYKFANYVLE